jgi:hypothetical protein
MINTTVRYTDAYELRRYLASLRAAGYAVKIRPALDKPPKTRPQSKVMRRNLVLTERPKIADDN